ncbi:DNA-binding transcriptional regulator, CsgD family [Limimonas halophila]|uniref:DNA-binding transcriptional regulator, CsgD family n=1 Tax=Limimonas halophila TaxID=1082479 RepID=A0A1G7STS9_9PROT|nr:LuxR family transcriptional regulator [Limimonas halophila]SDG25690.1 DNA-binding transcriptional regulator, CsgD family [Limimonas halophila]
MPTPNNPVSRVSAQLRNISDLSQLRVVFHDITQSLGFDWYVYANFRTLGSFDTPPSLISNYPQGWLDEYMENQYDRIDPVVGRTVREISPFLWSRLYPDFRKTDQERHMMERAASWGLRTGYVVPVSKNSKTVALVSFVSRHDIDVVEPMVASEGDALSYVAIIIYNAIANISRKWKHDIPKLSKRETEVLRALSAGKSAKQTAAELGITANTVYFHNMRIKKKLKVRNLEHAISVATEFNLYQ